MLILREEDVSSVLDPVQLVDVIEEQLLEQADGKTFLPQRLTTDFEHGWFRLMPGAIVGERGRPIMGAKVMNFIKGVGLYYLVLLYDEVTGDLLAQMDASTLTKLRTGAASGVFVRKALPDGAGTVGVLGSGYEARGQLEIIARTIPLGKVRVYSPTPANRETFAREMGELLKLEIEPVASPQQAVEGADLIVGAVKSDRPVAEADWFAPNAVVVSIGSTRPVERELAPAVYGRTRLVVADHKEQALAESGDIQAAVDGGHLQPEQVVELYDLVAGRVDLQIGAGALTIFKTVGTALQDLAVARFVYERCVATGRGQKLENFLTRKPVAPTTMH